MNKGLRQFLVFFIFLCVIMLAVLVVQVFILGEKAELDAELPAMVGKESPPPEEESAAPTAETVYTSPPADETPPEETQTEPFDAVSAPPPPDGMERVALPLPGKGTLLIDYYPDVFEHVEDDDDKFMYISPDGGDASMTVLFKQNQTASGLAPRFFDDASPDTVMPGGTQAIGRTGLTGEYVKALLGEEVFEAWLLDVDGGVIAFSIKYIDETELEALHGLIDSMGLAH